MPALAVDALPAPASPASVISRALTRPRAFDNAIFPQAFVHNLRDALANEATAGDHNQIQFATRA